MTYDPKTCWLKMESKVPRKRFLRIWPPGDGDPEWTPEKWKRGDTITVAGCHGQVVDLTEHYVVLDTQPWRGPPMKKEVQA